MYGYLERHLFGKSFDSPEELVSYVQSLTSGSYNLMKACRVYFNAMEKFGLIEESLLIRYRRFLKMKRSKVDVYVPSDREVFDSLKEVKEVKYIGLLFEVLMWSGIRLVEGLQFLETYDESKFRVYDTFVSYPFALKRGQKTVNNVYLPKSVYNKLEHINLTYGYARKKYKESGGKISLKYLRKWNFNMLLYKGVPESVADFIQGRSSGSIGASHYMAKSQQAEFWYGKVVEKFK